MSPRKHILLTWEGATFLADRRASGKGRGLEKPVMPPMQESHSRGHRLTVKTPLASILYAKDKSEGHGLQFQRSDEQFIHGSHF